MKEIKGNLWSPEFDGCWRVIPINTTVIKSTQKLVMGAGLAKQAKIRYENLDGLWGSYYLLKPKSQLVVYHANKLIGFPTKVYWKNNSSLELIENGLKELKFYLSEFDEIVCPRLGCGLGQLDWVKDVKPLMLKYFDTNDNFIVASL